MKPRKYSDLRAKDWLIREVSKDDRGLTKRFAEKFGISRAAANNFIKDCINKELLIRSESSTRPQYSLGKNRTLIKWYSLDKKRNPLDEPLLDESKAWADDFLPFLGELKDNVKIICDYGFTEMVNNAKDHSGGSEVLAAIFKEDKDITIFIGDDGIGVYQKISDQLNLNDLRLAHFELCKGKLTTDKENHTGEGIFFTSRSFDTYSLKANGLEFQHKKINKSDCLKDIENSSQGTSVFMEISLDSGRNLADVFNEYVSDREEYTFDKTIIPVNLAKIGEENLVSRSQAKRLLSRVTSFKFVELDFKNVDFIGQAFADEIFRVFQNSHPGITFLVSNANEQIENMVRRAKNTRL